MLGIRHKPPLGTGRRDWESQLRPFEIIGVSLPETAEPRIQDAGGVLLPFPHSRAARETGVKTESPRGIATRGLDAVVPKAVVTRIAPCPRNLRQGAIKREKSLWA